MGLGSFKKKTQPGFVMPVFTYPRPLAKKLRAMEKVKALAQRISSDIEDSMSDDLDARSWGYQEGILLSVNEANLLLSALQSKEEELKAKDAMIDELKKGWLVDKASLKLYFELSKAQEEQLKAKDEEVAGLTKHRDVLIEDNQKLSDDVKSLTSEVERLEVLLKSISDYYSDREKPKEISATLFTIDSRSTQSTDKP